MPDAGQLGQPLMDVAVYGVELPRRVAISEVRTPAPQHGVEAFDDHGHVEAGVAPRGPFFDLGPIALWLGHESVATTARIYLHGDMSIKERALERTRPLERRYTHNPPSYIGPGQDCDLARLQRVPGSRS